MDMARILRALRRRWYLVAIGVLVTMGLSTVAYQLVPFTYEANGSVLLLPPGYDKHNGSNPFLQLDGLDLPASVVVAYLEGEGPQQQLARDFPSAAYSVAIDATTRGPVLSVIVDDATPDSTLVALDAVLNAIPAALRDLQSQLKVGSGSTIGSMRLAVDTHPTVVRKNTVRAVVAVFALGVVLSLMATVGADTLLDRPRTGRSRDAGEPQVDPDGLGPRTGTAPEDCESAARERDLSPEHDDDQRVHDQLSEGAVAELESAQSR